jgi:hypothetical protein
VSPATEPLDENTLDRIADLICDSDGPNHRQAWQLPIFFRQAGWADVPEYTEIGRKHWVLELLHERRNDPSAIEKALRRLTDPREYPDGPGEAQLVARALNRTLALEGLKVTYAGGRPVVVRLAAAMVSPDAPAPIDLQRDMSAFIRDGAMAGILQMRLDEAATCREHGACLATIILLGSVLEGALLDVAFRFIATAMQSSRAPKGKKLAAWTLAELIDVEHELGWIQPDVQAFSHSLRDYRNFVHPREQLKRQEFPDQDTVSVCWDVVIAALNDLGVAVAAAGDGA